MSDTGEAGGEYLLEALDIVKRYGDFTANDRVTLKLRPRPDSTHCSARNGAGKSTLVKIMYGALQPTAGTLRWGGQPVSIASPAARAPARHRHGLPALLPVRGADRGREHRAGAARPVRPRRAGPARDRRIRGVRAAAGTGGAGRGPVRRRAAAHRDRALPAAGTAPADHGRADLRAHPTGGGPALSDAAAPGRRRVRGALHLPSAGGGAAALPRRHDPSPRQGRRERRPAGRDGGVPGAADGRRGRPRRARGGDTRTTAKRRSPSTG